MKWLTFEVQRTPGFRFNLTDLLLIGSLVGLSVFIYRIYPHDFYYLLPIYVGGSFFLFCNVFRIGNRLEPWWYLTFLLITLALMRKPDLYWPVMLGICEPLKAALIVYRILQPGYVGVFSKADLATVENPD